MKREKAALYTIGVLVALGLIGIVHSWRSRDVGVRYAARDIATFGTAEAAPSPVAGSPSPSDTPAEAAQPERRRHNGWPTPQEVQDEHSNSDARDDDTPRLKRRTSQAQKNPDSGSVAAAPAAAPVSASRAPAPPVSPEDHPGSHTTSTPPAPAHDTTPVVRERSRNQSIAIVAGSAAAGALIGGLAGHGRGAAIGALAGAAGGYVYDRYTRRKRAEPDASAGRSVP